MATTHETELKFFREYVHESNQLSAAVGAACGAPVAREWHVAYKEACQEAIMWDAQEGNIVWCLSGHEWRLKGA